MTGQLALEIDHGLKEITSEMDSIDIILGYLVQNIFFEHFKLSVAILEYANYQNCPKLPFEQPNGYYSSIGPHESTNP